MDDLLIRPMCVADADAVGELAAQLGYARSIEDIGRWIAAADDSRVALVAVVADRVIGWIQAHELDLLFHARVLEIGGLVVSADARGGGVGRELVSAVIEWGRDNGHTEVWVRSNIVRERAHSFYEDLGFTRVKTSYSFARTIG